MICSTQGIHATATLAVQIPFGYTGLWELFRSNRSVTESATSPNTRKGLIEEIAKPCPPRCDDLNGITKTIFNSTLYASY